MNKVKIMTGQKWKCDVIGGPVIRTIRGVTENGEYHNDIYFTDSNWMKEGELYGCGEFIPQTNLEWLAVAIKRWSFTDGFNVSKVETAPLGYLVGKVEKFYESYTKQEWQNKRYELGLDDNKQEETKVDEIKIPVKWILKKGINPISDDNCVRVGKESFITSFSERENTGLQPVSDWVPVIITYPSESKDKVFSGEVEWSLRSDRTIPLWKPNIQ